MISRENRTISWIRILQGIAGISAFFGILLSVLIVVNFLQSKRADPLNGQGMTVLVEKLRSNPGDEALKSEIRQLDLLARKAFFTNQWQVKTGGLMLFAFFLIVLLSMQTIDYLRKKIPTVPVQNDFQYFELKKINRTWIIYSALGLLILAGTMAYFSYRNLELKLQTSLNRQISGDDTLTEKESGQAENGITAKVDSKDTLAGSSDAKVAGFPDNKQLHENFPGFRGLDGIGIAYQKNIPVNWDGKSSRNIKWKTKIPLPGYNSPIIWGNKIFVSGANESKREIYCLDINSGKFLWKTTVDNVPGSPGGVPKVNIETGYGASTLATDGQRVYGIFANGDIVALDMDGKRLWSKNLGLPKNHYGHASSLITYEDKVLVQFDQTGNAALLALSGKTGESIWRTSRSVKVSWSSPILIHHKGITEVVLAADPYVAAYNVTTGKEDWRINCISGEVGPSLAYAKNRVFSVNEYSKLCAIQPGDPPKQLWEDSDYLSDVPSPVATEDYLFLCTSYGTFVCYEAETGKKLWEKDFGTHVYASPMIAEGKIYLLDQKGSMHIFKASPTYIPVSESLLGEGSFCTPAFQEGKIIIRGNTNLYCIGN